MSDRFVPYGRQSVDESDCDAVVEALQSAWLTTGPQVEQFEQELARCCANTHAVALNSGTSALHAAYHAAGIGPGDEVIVPSLTFSATANAAVHLGAAVRFADVDAESLTIDPDAVAGLVTEKTAAIVAVDFAGHPCHFDDLSQIATDANVRLINDAAHSLGARYRGRPIGSVADLTCFSFHPVKAVTTAEGGAVVCASAKLADKARQFGNHGIARGVRPADHKQAGLWWYDIEEMGLNYRLSDLHCALGRSQLQKLEAWISRRRDIAGLYRALLADCQDLELPPNASWCEHAYHLFFIRVPAERRAHIFRQLRQRQLGVQVHYIPVNMLTAYRELGHAPEDTPVALEAFERIISIPCFPAMSDDDVRYVAQHIREVLAAT